MWTVGRIRRTVGQNPLARLLGTGLRRREVSGATREARFRQRRWWEPGLWGIVPAGFYLASSRLWISVCEMANAGGFF